MDEQATAFDMQETYQEWSTRAIAKVNLISKEEHELVDLIIANRRVMSREISEKLERVLAARGL